MSYFAKVNKVTGEIIGHGRLNPSDAMRVPCTEDQMMIEVAESVDPTRHSFVDLNTHELLDADHQPVVVQQEIAQSVPIVNSPVKFLPVKDKL